jgi:spoIIIJ-associated protein
MVLYSTIGTIQSDFLISEFDVSVGSVYQHSMNEVDAAGKILNTMLEKLGFQAELEVSVNEDGPCLNITAEEGATLIGKNGDRLEDLQYLTNRILIKHYPDAPRIRVDCDHYRANQEKIMLDDARELAKQVIEDGEPQQLRPLNAYYRRLAYNALKEIEGIKTSSPSGSVRYKRILIEKEA